MSNQKHVYHYNSHTGRLIIPYCFPVVVYTGDQQGFLIRAVAAKDRLENGKFMEFSVTAYCG